MNENGVKQFLRIKVKQWYYLIVVRGEGIAKNNSYKATFYKNFHGLGAGSSRIAQCSFHRRAIEFNMKKIRWNLDNKDGLEALVIHEICHIVSPRGHGAHGPAFEKMYQKYAGELAPAIDTLVM
jgi:predicted metal-dependent hydrolase